MVLPNTRYRTQRKYSAFARQKMNQTSNIGDPAGNKVKVPMTSDTTYPATVADSVMTVTGGGTANVTLTVNGSGNIFANVRLTLEQNGVAIGSVDIATQSNARTATLLGVPLNAGDQLALYAQRIGISNLGGDVRAASVDIVPNDTTPSEEIMYTVTANNPATTTLSSVTNLLWLPSGPAATTVPLKAGNWVMFVWIAPSAQAGTVQFGVETSQGVTMRQMVNGDGTNGYTSGVKFTIPTDQSVTVKQKQASTDAGLIGLKPGDVVAFAPIVTP